MLFTKLMERGIRGYELNPRVGSNYDDTAIYANFANRSETKKTRKMKKSILTLGTTVLVTISVFAQLGTIDPDFNLGTGFGPDQWTGKCETILQQPDGKLLVGGYFSEFNGTPIVR